MRQDRSTVADPIVCNPLDLGYAYSDLTVRGHTRVVWREGADPSLVRYRDRYYLFVSMSGGFWHSDDLATWEFVPTPELPVLDYAPDVREIDGALVFSASKHDAPCSFWRTTDPLAGFEEIPGPFPFWDPSLFQDDDGRVYLYWGCTPDRPLQGVELDRSTLANWVGGATWWLEPLRQRLATHVFGSAKIFADDTPLPVLDPGRGRTKIGRLWVYARDDRPWAGSDPPAAVYFYSPDRKAERPAAHLARFRGVLQVDGYPGFERLPAGGNIVLAACWAHARRKFYEFEQATGSPIAAEALRRIGALYAIEADIRGASAEERRLVRNIQTRPLVDSLKSWLETELHRIAPRSPLAEAIRYALSRWVALSRFLDDGRIELDTNTVERAIRPVTLGRKNHLFAGSDGGADRWAVVASLLATAKLNGVEPFAYLKDVLERLTEGHPMSRLDELLPWNWRDAQTL